MSLRVAAIGLGNMGGPMARNVVDAGFPTTVFDIDADKAAAVGGADTAPDIAAAVADADLVMTSLPGPVQVRAVGDELFAAMRAGSTWLDLSTNDLGCARALVGPAADAGVELLDGPVTGGAEGAEAGTLSVLVGGDAAVHARALPVLETIGDRHDLLGPYGAGYVAKIASVSLCYLQSVCLTEALLLGTKGGVDPAMMLDIIQHSTGRSYVADRYGPEILNGGYDDSFDLGLALKDLRLATDLGDAVDATTPFMRHVLDLYRGAEATFGATAPHLIAMQSLERANDLLLHETGDTR
ncbi:MAG: NAD(P)-dependent oxidoreductase [Actinomycetota bacterium]